MSEKSREQLGVTPWAASLALAGLSLYLARKNRQLNHIATHDKLTGLLNTRGLEGLLIKNGPPQALLYLDGTNQKAVNDKLGHKRGDEAIIGTAEVIKSSMRPHDQAARIGGDEFLVVVNTDPRQYRRFLSQTPEHILDTVIARVYDRTQEYLTANPDLMDVGFNIAVGGAIWSEGHSINDLRSIAEDNMYALKQSQHDDTGRHR